MYENEDPRREGYTPPWDRPPEVPREPEPPAAPSTEPPSGERVAVRRADG